MTHQKHDSQLKTVWTTVRHEENFNFFAAVDSKNRVHKNLGLEVINADYSRF